MLRALMRIYSFLYHAVLALFLFGISSLALIGGTHTLRIDVLPWQGKTLTFLLFFSAVYALLSILLALKGKARVLFFVWSVIVPVAMLRGYFLSSHYFERGEFATAVYLTIGAILAVAGGWYQLRPARREQWEHARV